MRATGRLSGGGWRAAVAITVLSLGACGGGGSGGPRSLAQSSAGSPSATQEPGSPSPGPSASPTGGGVIDPASLTHINTYRLSNSQGNTATATLRRGDVQRAAALQIGSVQLAAGCTVNGTTDAVIPFSLSLTNTTAGFPDTDVGLGLQEIKGLNPSFTGQVDGEQAISTGTQCQTLWSFGEEGLGGVEVYDDSLPAGQSVTTEGFFIITDYYTPDQPQGDSGVFAGVTIGVATRLSWSIQPPYPLGASSEPVALIPG